MRSVWAAIIAAGAVACGAVTFADPQTQPASGATAPLASPTNTAGADGPAATNAPTDAVGATASAPPSTPAVDATNATNPAAPVATTAEAQAATPAQAGDAVGFLQLSKPAPFLADTAGKQAVAGAFGMIGAIAAYEMQAKAGAKIVAENGVQDPSTEIAQRLAAAYAAAHGGHVAAAPIVVDHRMEAGQLSSIANGARYVVDVETRWWGFIYYSLDWSHYHVTYIGYLRVFDLSTNRIVAKGACTHKYVAANEKFSYDELTGNGAQVLKSQLGAVADECVAKFKTDVLKI